MTEVVANSAQVSLTTKPSAKDTEPTNQQKGNRGELAEETTRSTQSRTSPRRPRPATSVMSGNVPRQSTQRARS